jgi:hypothetical protein
MVGTSAKHQHVADANTLSFVEVDVKPMLYVKEEVTTPHIAMVIPKPSKK